MLLRLNERVRYKFSNVDFFDPQIKVSLLLQCHLFGIKADCYNLVDILDTSIELFSALVDILASRGDLLKATLSCMEMCQSIIQGQSSTDLPLQQIPNISKELAQQIREQFNINNIYDLVEREDLTQILNQFFTDSQQQEILYFISGYPNLAIVYDYQTGMVPSEHQLNIQIEHIPFTNIELSSNDKSSIVIPIVKCCNRLSFNKRHEAWWIVVGDEKTDQLLAIKRISFGQMTKLQIPIELEQESSSKLYVISDCYLGCDQEFKLDQQ